MSFLDSFALSILPAGISLVILFLIKNRVDSVILKYDTEYKPKNNSLSLSKMLKIYSLCNSLEKRLLVLTMLSIIIGYITILTWAVLFLFFPNYVFSD